MLKAATKWVLRRMKCRQQWTRYWKRLMRGCINSMWAKKILPSQVERANLVLIPPPAVLFEVLPIALQTPWESPSTLQKYEIIPT